MLPNEFRELRRLEGVLVAKRILFKKVTVMPKGQSPKVKGSICNIPISEIDNNCNSLVRPADSNGVIIVKLKRKAVYRGHVLFEPVRPRLIESLLQYLKKHNHLYRNIEIDIENIQEELLSQIGNISEENAYNYLVKNITNPIGIIIDSLVGNKDHEEINPSGIRISGSGILADDCMNQEINDNARSDQKFYIKGFENSLAHFQTPSAETNITTEIPTLDELEEGIEIAPGEGKKPLSILHDDYCEEVAHPHLFATGKFGYKVKRKSHLAPSKYLNQRLLHYSQQFALDTDYIFFTHAVMQKFLFEVLAMVKQLGIPTFFMTLLCADLRWNELVEIISKFNRLDTSDHVIKNMTYQERCNTLKKIQF